MKTIFTFYLSRSRIIHPFLLLILVTAILACHSSKTVKEPNRSNFTDRRASIVTSAQNYLGTPYRYGGSDHRGMDCSGLVYTVFKKAAIALPRSSAKQSRFGKKVSSKDASPGDLIFFARDKKVFHVGIITRKNNNRIWMIHGSSSRGVIEEEFSNNAYWSPKVYLFRAIL